MLFDVGDFFDFDYESHFFGFTGSNQHGLFGCDL